MFPSSRREHLRFRAAVAKLPWQPSGRGRSISLGNNTKREYAAKARGEVLLSDRARDSVFSRAFLRLTDASLGKQRRFTGTL